MGGGGQGETLRAALQYHGPSYLWTGLNIHIGYSPANPHIMQTTIILTAISLSQTRVPEHL
jgi:hypothetical protein